MSLSIFSDERSGGKPEKALNLDNLHTADRTLRLESNSEPARSIVSYFKKQADLTPDSIALVAGDSRYSYRELDRKSGAIAFHLQTMSAGSRRFIGIYSGRSAEAVTAMLGIQKSGNAYVPLDPTFPAERLRVLVTEAEIGLILVREKHHDELRIKLGESKRSVNIVVLEHIELSSESTDEMGTVEYPSPGDPAYAMFTSGTTGKPKAVVVPHRAVVRLVNDPSYISISSSDVFLQLAPLSFDASTFEIWGSLLNGATLEVFSHEMFSFDDLAKFLVARNVTVAWLTAALFHQMVEKEPESLQNLRYLLTGGDVVSPSAARKYLELPRHGRLVNGYGPTENTTFTCCCQLDQSEQIGKTVPIGLPISGTSVYILDANRNLVPIGVPGEIYTGGDGLAIGYLNDKEATERSFVPNPFSQSGGRLYATGDIGKWRPDGQIEFLGRKDHQVKIRGYRIEPAEIEAAVTSHPGVQECAIVKELADDNSAHLVQLRAFYVVRDSSSVATADLRKYLTEKLPLYMIPGTLNRIDHLPLLENGKVDRTALLEIPVSEDPLQGTEEISENPLEVLLLEMWQDLFGRKDITREDNFFDLGGHSLLAAQLVSKIEAVLGVHFPIAAFFNAQTIASLANYLATVRTDSRHEALVPLRAEGSHTPMYFFHGITGEVYCFLDLVRQLDAEYPVYGIQAFGMTNLQNAHTSMSAMITDYLDEIRNHQPHGPYTLCGYSMGGLLAYETARRLVDAGEEVENLILLDTIPLCQMSRALLAFRLVNHWSRRMLIHIRNILKSEVRQIPAYVIKRFRSLWIYAVSNRVGGPIRNDLKDTNDPSRQFQDHMRRITSEYRIKRYRGRTDILVTSENKARFGAIWKVLTYGRAKFHPVSYGHLELLSDRFLPETAAIINRILKRERDASRLRS